ncbi:MAG: asparagine synthase-related protein [Candidatus Methanoperedens sp.]|nr:asparagine synthase-related protein [Candidatus Methanoperedens sp.]
MMSGIAGDTANKDVLEIIAQMRYINRYSQKKANEILTSSGNIGLGMFCRQDSSECYVLKENSKTGVIDGFVYIDNESRENKNELHKKVITSILQAPERTLTELNGSFLIAATDGRKLIVATDKLATRPCFYSFQKGRLLIGSQIKSILPLLEKKSINIEGIGDLLAFEFLLGERTLVNEICSVPAASFIEWKNGEIKKKKYWNFNFKYKKSDVEYPSRLLKLYEESVDNVLKTKGSSQKVGIFLSGGLDSRLLFGVLLKKNIKFLTITYDTNPPGGKNPAISKRISEQFGIENIIVDFPYDVADSPEMIKESVWITDGLTPWHFFYNMNFDLNHLHRHVDVIINNPRQGEFFGEDLSMNELTSALTPVEILRNNSRTFRNPVAENIIESLLKDKYSVKNEIQKRILKSGRSSNYEILFDVMFCNYYTNFYRTHLSTNLVEIKNIFPGAKLLDEIAGLPLSFRMRRLPVATKIPMYPVSPLKIELIRLVDKGLEKIPYERTGASPGEGMYMHLLRFAKKSLLKKKVYDFGKLIREGKLRNYIYTDVDYLCKRELIDDEVVYDILDKHMQGKADFSRLIGSLTTAGLFVEKAFG